MSNLASKSCKPCKGETPPLNEAQIAPLLNELDNWEVIDNHHLTKPCTFPDFVSALKFVNDVGELAELQGHHPNIFLTWGKVQIDIWTHKIDGLTESDFILAAKIDALG